MLVKPGMDVVGKTLAEAGLFNPDAAKLLAVRRLEGELHVNPGPDLRLEEGDLLIALGSEGELFNLAALLK
jgi:K+/H+ antiporter YhaU regulatory subunit KhtT